MVPLSAQARDRQRCAAYGLLAGQAQRRGLGVGCASARGTLVAAGFGHRERGVLAGLIGKRSAARGPFPPGESVTGNLCGLCPPYTYVLQAVSSALSLCRKAWPG